MWIFGFRIYAFSAGNIKFNAASSFSPPSRHMAPIYKNKETSQIKEPMKMNLILKVGTFQNACQESKNGGCEVDGMEWMDGWNCKDGNWNGQQE